MKLNFSSTQKEVQFLSDLSDLEKIDLKDKSKKTFVLNGPLLLAYLGPYKQNLNYIPQESRQTSIQLLPKSSTKITLALKKEALSFFAKNKIKPVFGIDGILKSSSKIKDEEFYYFFATSNEEKSYVCCAQINKKEVVQLYSFEANAYETPAFSEDIHNLIERLQQTKPIRKMYWAGPLKPPSTQDVESIKVDWQSLKANSITATGGPSKIEKYGLASLIFISSLIVGSYLVYAPYNQYLKEKQTFLEESKKFESQQVFTSERLNLLKTKNSFMLENEKQKIPFSKVETVLSYLIQKNILLQNLVIISPFERSKADFDFKITIRVPAEQGVTPLNQGYALLSELSSHTGFIFRLSGSDSYKVEVQSGPSSVDTDKEVAITYAIEGVFK